MLCLLTCSLHETPIDGQVSLSRLQLFQWHSAPCQACHSTAARPEWKYVRPGGLVAVPPVLHLAAHTQQAVSTVPNGVSWPSQLLCSTAAAAGNTPHR